ncbi:MAG: homoserine dehydrogenase [Chloroflexi bacterium]|nr:homoserine dehydrogenase [Chloroflexota bacterium]
MMRNGIAIGLLGVGTIGSSVLRTIVEHKSSFIADKIGCPVHIKRVLVRDLQKERRVELPPGLATTDAREILDDPEIDIVVELMGGETPAHEYIRAAVLNRKHVVTANKEVMSKHGTELLELAWQQDVDIYFEASVGGGIPLIGPLKQDLAANQILSIKAIINGTTNYILTRMAEENADFASALRQAQALGYAEPDPTNDVEGIDATYKLAILATLAFRIRVRPGDIFRAGITALHPRDFQFARELGYAIKLLAIAKRTDNQVEARVHPTLVPNRFLLAQVNDVYNAVHVEGDLVGKVLFYGQGAGPAPTSSAIVGDIIDLAHNIIAGVSTRIRFKPDITLSLKPMDGVLTRYYLRMQVADRPGVLAQIARVLGDNDISIASVIQKEVDEIAPYAEIIIMTHAALEKHVQQARAELIVLPVVKEIANFIRVEDHD